MSARGAWLLLAGLAVLSPALARAQISAEDVAAARGHWRRGRDLAQEGDWEGARDAFAASLELVPRVSVLLSLATAEVRLGHGREALEALDALDALAHPSRDARHLEAAQRLRPRAEALAEEQARAEAEAAEAAAAEPEPEPVVEPEPEPVVEPAPEPADDSMVHVIGGAVTAGVGVLTLIATAITFGLREDALSRRDGLCPGQVCGTEPDRAEALGAHADASTFNDAANGLGIAGAILVAGGAAWLVVGLVTGGSSDGDVALAPWLSDDGAGLAATGRY